MGMDIPPRFKPVTMYVRRAEELDRAPEPEAPVVAYQCRLYAVDQAMKIQDGSEASNQFMVKLIERLEADKPRMAGFSEEETKKMCVDWAMGKFNKADEEDRAGLADQSTARAFYAAGAFFDVLRQFGDSDPEMDRRRIYCKWKASQILKALKEGRAPSPGGAGEEMSTGMPPASTTSMPAAPDEQQHGISLSTGEKTHQNSTAGIVPDSAAANSINARDASIPSVPVSSPQPEYTYEPTPTYPTPSSYKPSPIPAPYDAPAAPEPAHAPHGVSPPAPAPAVYVPPAQPSYSPPPSRPRTPVPSASGSRRTSGKPLEGDIADAIELCRFAIRALEHKDVNLGVERLGEALRQLT